MSDSAGDSDDGESRRKRIRQACLNCRRKKIRCDGTKPICRCCSRLSQSCMYAIDGRSTRSASFTNLVTDEAFESMSGAMTSNFSALENRLQRIERALERIATLSASGSPTPSSLGPTSSPRSHYRESRPPAVPEDHRLVTESYPSIYTLLFAADVYFKFNHNQPYSLFHEETFRARLEAGEVPSCLAWALLAIARHYTALPDASNDGNVDAMYYTKKAWESLKLPWDGAASEQDALYILQTIVLIVKIEHTGGYCASSYMKLGFGLRFALQRRYHLEPCNELTTIFKEEKRRTFWSLYLQDRLMCLSRERTPLIRDDECSVRLPCSEVAFRDGREEETPALDCFISDNLNPDLAHRCCPLALIAITASILNRVSQFMLQDNKFAQIGPPWIAGSPYASISATLLQLEDLFGMNEPHKDTIEKRCLVNGVVDQHLAGPFIYSKALFHLSQCLLHHPFLLQQRLRKTKHRAPVSFAKTAWHICRTHAKSLTDLENMRRYNVLVLTSVYGYCTMVAGTIHVIAMNDDDPDIRQEGQKNHKTALEILQELSKNWKHAGLMATRLERFRQQMEGHGHLQDLDEHAAQSPADLKLLWQSVDYSLLSTPTPPSSPRLTDSSRYPQDVNSATPQSFHTGHMPDFFMSPSRLFDMTAEIDSFATFPSYLPLEESAILPNGAPLVMTGLDTAL